MTAEALFHALLDLPEAERSAVLLQQCPTDSMLRGRVERLLAAHMRDTAFLETPPSRAEVSRALSDVGNGGLMAGQRLGGYVLQELIGAGGMAHVWRARRADPEFRHDVAIKVLKRGMDSDEIVRRFLSERLVLSQLEHPNIARWLDAGASDDGLPFLVLECVVGVPVDVYCDRMRLSVPERIRLFNVICAAVQFAHQRLVVHRDLKPSNILINADGAPKLLDFGIAKVLTEQDDDSRIQTLPQHRVFTPGYASPEQVAGRPITTATDVYSLGVVLYELLCGARPHAPDTTDRAELERLILHADPPPPSQAIGAQKNGDRATAGGDVADSRRCNPRDLRRALTGDLDTIVLKALRKEPDRRYASADELSRDLQRHLSRMPVTARADTLKYRASKFVRRNSVWVGTGAALALSLLGGLATSLRLYHQASTARAAAQSALNAELDARKQTDAARHDAEWQAYVAAIFGAESALRALDAGDARRQLELAPPSLRGWEWRHLWQRCDHGKRVVNWPYGVATAMAFMPGSGLLLIGDDRGDLHTVDSTSGDIQSLSGIGRRSEGILRMAISSDGAHLALALFDGKVELIHLADGVAIPMPSLPGSRRFGIEFSPDDTLLAVSGNGIELLRVADGGTALSIAHPRTIYALAFSPLGDRIAGSDMTCTIPTWSTADGAMEEAIIADQPCGQQLRWSADGQHLLVCNTDQAARVWSFESRHWRHVLRGHTDDVMGIGFSTDGRLIYTSSRDHTLRGWSMQTGEQTRTWLGTACPVRLMAIGAEGQGIASIDSMNVIRFWDPGTDDVPRVPSRVPRIWRFATAQNSPLVAMCDPRAIEIAEPFGAESIANADLTFGALMNCAMAANGSVLLAGRDDGAVLVWRQPFDEAPTLSKVHSHLVAAAAVTPDGAWGATVDSSGKIAIWPLHDKGQQPEWLPIEEGAAHAIDNPRRIKSIVGQVRLRDRNVDGAPVRAPPATNDIAHPESSVTDHDLSLRRIRARPDHYKGPGQTVSLPKRSLAASAPARPAAVSPDSLRVPHRGTASSLTISPDGRFLASIALDSGVSVWRLADRTRIDQLTNITKPACAAYSPDGKWLGIGCENGDLHLLSAESRQPCGILRGHSEKVNSIAFSHDQSRIATASNDRTIRLWDVPTGHCVAVLHGPGAFVTSVAFINQDRTLLSLHGERTVLAWTTDR